MSLTGYLLLVAAITVAAVSALGLIELVDYCFEQSGLAQKQPPLPRTTQTAKEAPSAVTGEASTIYDWDAEGVA